MDSGLFWCSVEVGLAVGNGRVCLFWVERMGVRREKTGYSDDGNGQAGESALTVEI